MSFSSEQEIFTAAVEGLARQNWQQSLAPFKWPRCRYLSPAGLRCAIGQLIPEGKYDPAFDTRYCLEEVLAVCGIPSEHWSFCSQLQNCHDLGETEEEMKRMLKALATRHGLTLPPSLLSKEPN